MAPVDPAPPPARWWDALGDPVLTQLIDDAFAASPTLKTAAARIRAARAQQLVNLAGLLPTGSATLAARTATIGQNVASHFPTVSLLGFILGWGAPPPASPPEGDAGPAPLASNGQTLEIGSSGSR